MLRRTVAATLVAAVALAVLVPAALASGPSRDYLPIDSPIDADPGVFCAFPVRIDVLVNTEYGVTFRDESGDVVRQLVAGRLIVRITDTQNGHSVVANISGPAQTILHADGSWTYILRGNSLPITPGVLVLTTGTVVQEFDAAGTLVSQTHQGGTEQDLCLALS